MTQASETSRTLLGRLRREETDAWHRLVGLYGPLVRYWCRRSGLTSEDVDDVAQEVFRAVHAGMSTFRRERPGDSFRGWLRRITRNKIIDHVRWMGRQQEGAGGSSIFSRVAAVDGHAETMHERREIGVERLLLRRCLDMIRERVREQTWRAFERTVIDGVAPHLVAEELSMSAGAVRVAKSRVLQRLRVALGDREG